MSIASSSKRHTNKPALNVSWILDPAKFITWLGASIGGLNILLGVIGFLAIGAHDAMLGIPETRLIVLDYVRVGGLFFSRSIIYMIADKWCWLILAIFICFLFAYFHIFKRYLEVITLIGAIGLIPAEFCLFLLLGQSLQFTDLLLHNPDNPNSVLVAILGNDTRWMQNQYGILALLVLFMVFAFKYLEQAYQNITQASNNRAWRLWRWLRIPAFILFIICLFFLPRIYGVLTIPNEYQQVREIVTTTPNSVCKNLNSTFFLLREDDKSLLLYDPHSSSIIKLDSVVQFRTFERKNIFAR